MADPATAMTMADKMEMGGGIVKGGTDILALMFDIWEYNDTKKEMRRIEEKADKRQAFMDDRYAKEYQTTLSMTRQNFREGKRRFDANRADAMEERQYKRGQDAVTHLLSTLAQKPQLENRMMSIFPSRRHF